MLVMPTIGERRLCFWVLSCVTFLADVLIHYSSFYLLYVYRGVSGGQRRRVTVGEMMVGQNAVACADEISTGLDAAVTFDIVRYVTHSYVMALV